MTDHLEMMPDEGKQDSPRLRWMKKWGVEIIELPSVTENEEDEFGNEYGRFNVHLKMEPEGSTPRGCGPTFSEYSKRAAETQMESCKGAAYLDAALIGEVGELCSLYAKSVRGDYDLTDRISDIKKESGDLCWMASMKTVQAGYDLAELIQTDDLEKAHKTALACWDEPQDAEYLLQEIAFYAVLMADTRPGGCSECKDEFKRHVTMFFAALSVFLDNFGLTLADAMNANVEKLTKRKAQGQIMGSGDHREEQFGDAPQCGSLD